MHKFKPLFLVGLLFLFLQMSEFASSDTLNLKGHFKQGGYALGRIKLGSRLTFLGYDVPRDSSGNFALGFPVDMTKADLVIGDEQGHELARATIKVEPREYRKMALNGLPQNMVSPPDEAKAKIKQDAEVMTGIRGSIFYDGGNELTRVATWSHPIKGRITDTYGTQRIMNGLVRSRHWGIDFAARSGTKIRVPLEGIVRYSDMQYFAGNTVVVDHGLGLMSAFLHLREPLVNVGKVVKTREVIGLVGASGRATGPHLDWRVSWLGVRIDGQFFLEKQQDRLVALVRNPRP